jgi:hypothetical protein
MLGRRTAPPTRPHRRHQGSASALPPLPFTCDLISSLMRLGFERYVENLYRPHCKENFGQSCEGVRPSIAWCDTARMR